ncbi:MAG: queuosine precursor transporter [Planctomycetota bacterium]
MSNPSPAVLHLRRERVFLVMAGLFLGTLTMLNILGVSRFIVLASYDPGAGFNWGVVGRYTFAVAVGVLPYPLTFLCTDLISEFYGRKRANFLVLVGLLLNLWVVSVMFIAGELPGFVPNDPVTGMPPPPEWNPEKGLYDENGWTFYQVRFLTLAAVSASMVAYLAAQLIDVQVFHFWKRLTKGKHLWLRNNGSTIVSQFVDTFAVITITHFYARALPVDDGEAIWPQLWLFIATGFVFKLVAALVDTPLIYLAVAVLKRYLQIDPTAEHAADEEEARLFQG